ncbi:uncharacterized protein LOC134271816 [Saccostrea cucullata]|uniref:uncharacterized protein LOC134271816 n=1 Tax=Saccostrea cuccullata TaxID=36930 RepID=UPI002ED0071B
MSLVTLSVDSDEKDVKEKEDREDFTPIQTHLRPFLVLLQCFALHYPENGQSLSHMKKIKAVHPMESPTRESKLSVQFVYCLVILIIMSLNVLRYIPSFWVGYDFIPNLTTPRVINIVWFCQCFFNSVFIFKTCSRYGNLHAFIHFYNSISTDEISRRLNLKTSYVKFRKIVWFMVAIGSGMIIFNVTGCFLIIFIEENKTFEILQTDPFPASRLVTLPILIVGLYCFAAWLLPLGLVALLLLLIKYQFDTITSRLQKLLKEDGQKAIFKINEIRLKHLQITKAVEILDRDIRLFFAGVYLAGILICCFIAYNLINRKISGTFEMVMYLYWLIMNKIIIISSSVLAAQVNEAVSLFVPVIHLNPDLFDTGYPKQVSLFVSKLNGPAVGFTMMSTVTITKELLLTLAGLYISYLFLLMQFQL